MVGTSLTRLCPPYGFALAFSIRARFDNFICDAVHSAVKLRSARFDISLCLHRLFGFRLRQIGGKVLARLFGNHMHHTQARLTQTPMELIMKTIASILFAAALTLSSAPAHAVVLDLSTMTCKQFVEGDDDTIKMVLTWMTAVRRRFRAAALNRRTFAPT